MFFFLLSNNRPSLVVIYLMLVKSLFFEVSVAPHYVSPTSLLMPVTTRSQSKCLQQAIGDHSFSIMSGSQLSLSMSSMTQPCNTSTISSSMVSTCNYNTSTSSHPEIPIISSCKPVLSLSKLSSLAVPSDLIFSNFQHFKISNNVDCHNSSDSKISIMEGHCEDIDTAQVTNPKAETHPDLNPFLSAIDSHITDATTKMTSDFHKVISTNSISSRKSWLPIQISNKRSGIN